MCARQIVIDPQFKYIYSVVFLEQPPLLLGTIISDKEHGGMLGIRIIGTQNKFIGRINNWREP
jgi:hypothetical protein